MAAKKYTDEMLDWMNNHRCKRANLKNVYNEFCNEFGCISSYEQFLDAYKSKKLLFSTRFTLSKEMRDFLLKNIKVYKTRPELLNAFNLYFDKNIKVCTLNRYVNSLGIKQIFKDYPKEVVNYILINSHKYDLEYTYDYDGIIKDLKEKFGIEYSKNNISMVRQKLGIHMKNKKSTFLRQDVKEKNFHKIGDEVKRKCDGIWFVKISDELGNYKKGCKGSNWKRKSRYMWELYTGENLQEDEYIIQIDGDLDNFERDNLYKIEKNEISIMKSNLWKAVGKDKELKELLLMQADLNGKIKKIRNEAE